MHIPKKSHLNIALRLLRYLKSNHGQGISVSKSSCLSLKGFVDADWAKCLVSRKSITIYSILFGNTLISWKSKKYDIVSHSSTEPEYLTLGTVSCEIIWKLKILFDIGIKNLIPVPIFCDNESTIKLVMNLFFHEKSKHFKVDTHFIRDKISKGIVQVVKVDSDHNVTNILIKSLGIIQHNVLSKRMGLVDPFQENVWLSSD